MLQITATCALVWFSQPLGSNLQRRFISELFKIAGGAGLVQSCAVSQSFRIDPPLQLTRLRAAPVCLSSAISLLCGQLEILPISVALALSG
jgi:hypothetical protein